MDTSTYLHQARKLIAKNKFSVALKSLKELVSESAPLNEVLIQFARHQAQNYWQRIELLLPGYRPFGGYVEMPQTRSYQHFLRKEETL